ncbi:MAG: VanZ family protein [Lachnospiraceae bacterium]|nr:VanZ family protein [Lachnospiraceae bacterium]
MSKVVKRKRLMFVSRLLFIVYLLFLLYFLLVSESMGRVTSDHYRYNLKPFVEINRFYNLFGTDSDLKAILNIYGNIICFIPFGLYFTWILKREKRLFIKIFLMTFIFSLTIETIQLFCKIGIFDVDDLILNTFGGVIGYVLCEIYLGISKIAKKG